MARVQSHVDQDETEGAQSRSRQAVHQGWQARQAKPSIHTYVHSTIHTRFSLNLRLNYKVNEWFSLVVKGKTDELRLKCGVNRQTPMTTGKRDGERERERKRKG